MKAVDIRLDYLKTVNYVMFHNRIPVCNSIEVANVSDTTLEDVMVTCEGELIRKFDSDLIAFIDKEETVRVSSFEITPDSSKLAALTERVITSFIITVKSKGNKIFEGMFYKLIV